ncbi:MAG: hypothetical protein QG574_545 [Cyanobacteriota bacterium erpe_2018_sw_21hr_WHONDRS-SW48-000092_B_bin.40]|nr:hypothetical protein [Cyanobacteriota bacterium erpe_2018_sw_21hr_WHONDRS-SW48-000092_B_bin.40]
MKETLAEKIVSNINPVDFAQGFYQGAIEKPVNGLRQLVGLEDKESKKSAKKSESSTLATEAGVIAGQIVDFSILAVASHGALKPLMKESVMNINGVAGTASKMFLAGAIDGGVLTTSSSDKGLLQGRLEAALVSGSTFAVMGGASKALEGVKLLPKNDFLAKSLSSALAGSAGGVTSAYGHAFTEEHRLASTSEVLSSAGQYAAFGAGFHAFNAGVVKVAKLPAVESAYYRTKWNIQEGATEGKRLYYATLNELNLQHPIKRLNDFVNPVKLPELPKVALTAENNPVTAFEKEYPQFIKNIEALEKKYEATPRGDRRNVYDEMAEEQARFAEKLLTILHGTADKPGLNSYSNLELAQGTHSIERVAAIRETLTASLKRQDFRSASAFEEGMAKLAPRDISGDPDTYTILRGLGQARERFFNFDERALSKKLSLPSEYHYKSRAYGTPADWMPFESSEKLSNLFHATVSRALDSIFTEGKLLPAKELRLRGIKQIAGESADEQFPRRAISMTRNFSEAFCYHRHSPESLADFPVVFGISRHAVAGAKGWNAGMLEPGELLTNKLNLGSGILEKLGLRKPDITHLFVPDTQVSAVSRALASHRIGGLRVIGFNDMDTPQWQPISH